MASGQRLGRLVAPARRRRFRGALALLWLSTVLGLAALATIAVLDGWLAGLIKPHKVLVRGCQLSSAEEVLGSLACSADSSLGDYILRARTVAAGDLTWVKQVRARPVTASSVLIDVKERLPLLKVRAEDKIYWLCDDLQLVPFDVASQHPVDVPAIPVLELPRDPGAAVLHSGEECLEIAAACHQQLPGSVAKIIQDHEGTYQLVTTHGIRVELGPPADVALKLSALPKALRIVEPQRQHLRYIDARDPRVFYPKWDYAINSKPKGTADTLPSVQ